MSNGPRAFLLAYAVAFSSMVALRLRDHLRFAATHPRQQVAFAGLVPVPRLAPARLALAGSGLVVLLVLAALGAYPRLALGGALVLYALYVGNTYGLPYVNRKTNLAALTIVILLCAPGLDRGFSSDVPGWPVAAAQTLLGAVYLSAALSKLRSSGRVWLTGEPLRAYLVDNYLWRDSERARALASSGSLCRVVAVVTLGLELVFGVAVVAAQLVAVPHVLVLALGAAILLLHAGSEYVMGIQYLYYWWPSFLCLLFPVGG